MRERGIAGSAALGLLVAAVALSGCKKGKASSSAADELREHALPSGTMSLQGMYSYMADAGIFIDCATREQWPVAMEGDNATLEREYAKASPGPGTPLLITVEGRVEPRPRMEGEGQETALVVERFVRTWPNETCGSIKAMSLEDTYWALLELDGATIVPTPSDEAPYLELNSNKASAYGFGGCNRFFGSYQASGRSLTFGDLGATRMACPEGMDQEQRFFAALASTTRYEIHGSKLLLLADDKVVARFEASGPTQ